MENHKILNWTARITGLLVLGFFLLFFMGEGLPDIAKGQGKELLRFLPFTIPTFAGFIVAWRRPPTGGWLMITGALVMAGYFLYFNDIRVAMIYGIPSLLIGLCFLAAGEKTLV